jgi:hypothetical protein
MILLYNCMHEIRNARQSVAMATGVYNLRAFILPFDYVFILKAIRWGVSEAV